MENFTWKSNTVYRFGKGVADDVADYFERYNKVLLVYGSGSIKLNGLYDKVMNSFKKRDIDVFELPGIKVNPDWDMVMNGVGIARRNNIDLILAVGGGSVIDTAKSIAFIAPLNPNIDAWNEFFMNASSVIPKGLACAVILTLPAAGSEMSESAVITNYETGYKRGIGGSNLRPDFSFVDPTYSLTLPHEQRANGVCDIYAHLHERFFSPSKNTKLTDGLILSAMKTIVEVGPAYVSNPNYDNAAEITLASTYAHNQSLSLGRIQDWASHWMEHELSTELNIAHGTGLAIVLPAWMKFVSRIKKDRFVQYASYIWGLPSYQSSVPVAIEKFENWLTSLGLPVRLTDEQRSRLDLDKISLRVLSGGRKLAGNYLRLTERQIKEIYILMS